MIDISKVHNSKQLQEDFEDTYKDFFGKGDLVLSGNFSFPRYSGGMINTNKHLRLRSKVPLKCFVSFKNTKGSGININSTKIFDMESGEFVEKSFGSIFNKNIEIVKHFSNFLATNTSHGYEINILSESDRGHGLGFAGTLFAIISVGLHILTKKINVQEVESGIRNSPAFDNIYELALDAGIINKNKNYGGSSIMSTLIDTFSPMFFQTPEDNSQIKDTCVSINSFFMNKNEPVLLPFDMVLLYSGTLTNHGLVEYVQNSYLNYFEELKNFINIEFINKGKFINSFSKKIIAGGSYDIINDFVGLLNNKILYLFVQIIRMQWTENTTYEIIDTINNLSNSLRLLEKHGSFGEDFLSEFNKNFKTNNIIKEVGIMPLSLSMLGGNYLIILPYKKHRETFKKTIESILINYPHIQLQHISWRDSNKEQGIEIEQFVSQSNYSKYIQGEKFIYMDNQGNKYIDSYNNIHEKEKGKGFLLDTINNKIFCNGEKLTSADIKSQSTTIELFDLLLSNSGQKIYNNELSASTYANQQNQMLGKIIMPFIKLGEKIFGEKVPLICKGSLRQFYIKLEKTKICIGIIKKV